jgi:TRAP-type C4-dicarboxylate transport system permease small subunit
MIQYHVMSLLFLAICAITAIEAIARFWENSIRTKTNGLGDPMGWLMVALCFGSLLFYLRTRRQRKKSLQNR